MHDDFERCYRAIQSKDARFDGWFVVAVLTTGVYCRPSCPVRPPFARNVRFLPTCGGRSGGGIPGLQTVPPRRLAWVSGMECA
ncbi:methylated-DNA--protein-cysteine methyltransferase [Mycobacterium tuberculosis]|nr:methylated-DNA--protein-cysteine methyltransferase [Mycobacterium tuberculosis]CKN88099.1 methylated-DNA--protein-cysteine methyltransferase [Mycobacterium tuberculosis]